MARKSLNNYLKINNKLKSINNKLTKLHNKIPDINKNVLKDKDSRYKNVRYSVNKMSKRRMSKYITLSLPAIMIVILIISLTKYYNYSNLNSTVILTGIPEDLTIENFIGEAEMKPIRMNIDKGRIINKDIIEVTVDGEIILVDVGELVIEFDNMKHFDKYLLPAANTFRTLNGDMRLTTNTNSDFSLSVSQISFQKSNNVSNYAFRDFSPEGNQNMYLNMCDFKLNGSLDLQDGETIECIGGLNIKIKGEEIVKNFQMSKELKVNSQIPEFPISFSVEIDKGELYFSQNNGFSLNGVITKFKGQTSINNGEMIYTTPNEQRRFIIGGIDVLGEGDQLDFSYDLNEEMNQLVINGKVNKLEISKINIIESIATFIYSNLSNILAAILAAIFASVFVNFIGKVRR